MALNVLNRNKTEQPTLDPTIAFDAPAVAEPEQAEVTGYTWPDPRKPSALLVPRHVTERIATAKAKRQMLLVIGASALVAALLILFAFHGNSSAKSDLAQAQQSQRTAEGKVAALKPVADYYDGLEKRRQATAQSLVNDVTHDKLFGAVLDALPKGSVLKNYATAFGSPCAGGAPFNPTVALGCVTATISTDGQGDVVTLLHNIEKAPASDILSDPFIADMNGSSNTSGGYDFNLTVNFNQNALSHKYVEQADVPTDPTASATANSSTGAGAQ